MKPNRRLSAIALTAAALGLSVLSLIITTLNPDSYGLAITLLAIAVIAISAAIILIITREP